jgi:hypothetical protein
MFTFETADQKEVRRFRIAQFNGRTATFQSNGLTVTGMVRSIVENKASSASAWVVTLIPDPPKTRAGTPRSASAPRGFAEA